jgi:hypothetical protein
MNKQITGIKPQRKATEEEAAMMRRLYHLPDDCEVIIDPNMGERDGPYFVGKLEETKKQPDCVCGDRGYCIHCG